MNLGELLSELRENILHDRSQRIAGDADHLWSDATLVRYINEAHRRFARKSCIIRDAVTPEVTQVTLVAGQRDYTLHTAVFAVISAKLTGDITDLARAGHSAFDTYRQPDATFFDPAFFTTLAPGKPLAYGTDEGMVLDDVNAISAMTLRVYPVPTATYAGQVINIRVLRTPLTPFRADDTEQLPEIPEDHHLEMLDWAAYLALRIVDHDGGDTPRAQEFANAFETHVMAARNNVMRKLFAPTQWSFGQSGWAWEK